MTTTAPLAGTERQIAEAINVNRSKVHAAIQENHITPAGRVGSHPTYSIRAVVDALAPRAGNGAIDIDRLSPTARDAYIRSERGLVKLRAECRELIPVGEVRRSHGLIFKAVADAFDTLPDNLERDCGLPTHALVRLEKHLDDARTELRRRIEGAETAHAEA